MDSPPPVKIGEHRTSDVIVRLRTIGERSEEVEVEGRDERFYCHTQLIADKSNYFALRLSPHWPTCQILDSRSCVEVRCHHWDFDYYVAALRLLYEPNSTHSFHNVRNVLGILRAAIYLECQQIADSCLKFLEASPWEEADEEEILRTVPVLGPEFSPILARLQPVDSTSTSSVFISAMKFATSSPSASMHDLKSSAQEQLEYILTEDDDAPLLSSCDLFKAETRKCMSNLMSKFHDLLEFLQIHLQNRNLEEGTIKNMRSFLADLSWACQILAKLELMKDMVRFWVDASTKVAETIEHLSANCSVLDIRLKVVEIVAKVLEPIGYGHVILPTANRLQMVKVWLPFVQKTKALADSFDSSDTVDGTQVKVDGEMWQSLESAFVSIVLALPSGDQAAILADWLKNEHITYPDLSEAFEVWCYRHKVARTRMSCFNGSSAVP